MKSRIYTGNVRHRRFLPMEHEINYSLFMPCIDLDEIDQLSNTVSMFGQRWWHWARFKRSDYLGEGCLKQQVQHKVYELTGERLAGRVEAVLHLRYFGLYFSPINLYYLYDEQGEWRYMLAEVSNTPWNERHYYALPADPGEKDNNWQHQKAFHVSPFNPIDQKYKWKLKPIKEKLSVHLECHKQHKVFDATMKMSQVPFSSKRLLWLLMKTPIQTVKVVWGIYWHALKLWLKGAPFYPHPKYDQKNTNKESW
ncbi:hypothetical protein JCM19233_2722 [Vibrio astriarenae]|nr:hypothetical protein JCM19233_2722 [Vibrio sp. C7]